MDQRNGLEVPETLEEICRPDRLALLIYDMQVGILGQIADADRVVAKVKEALERGACGGRSHVLHPARHAARRADGSSAAADVARRGSRWSASKT